MKAELCWMSAAVEAAVRQRRHATKPQHARQVAEQLDFDLKEESSDYLTEGSV